MYDPLLGRFMNADPYVQMPDYTQNFNRYSYCLNNPLKFTDPDGEWIWIPLMIIGAYIGGTSANDGELNPTQWNWQDGSTWGGVLIGGAVGALGGYGIMNPGSVELLIGVNSPWASAGLTIGGAAVATGAGTNWDYNFNWTTAAGGSGNYNMSGRNTSPEEIGERAVAQGRARANEQGEFRQYQPDFFDSWSESDNFLGKMSYDLTDGVSVTAQSLVLGSKAVHLNGEQVSGYDRSDAFVNTVQLGTGYMATPTRFSSFTSGPSNGVILRNYLGDGLMYIDRGPRQYGYRYSIKYGQRIKHKEFWTHLFDWGY